MACYLIRAGDTDKVKIGYAKNVSDRARTLQSAHWERLVLLRTWEGGTATEAWLHGQFSGLRIDRDWFVFDQVMLTIEAPSLAGRATRGRRSSGKHPAISAAFGGQSNLGRAIGVGQGTVSHWFSTGFFPHERILQVIDAAKRLEPPVALEPNDFFATSAGASV